MPVALPRHDYYFMQPSCFTIENSCNVCGVYFVIICSRSLLLFGASGKLAS